MKNIWPLAQMCRQDERRVRPSLPPLSTGIWSPSQQTLLLVQERSGRCRDCSTPWDGGIAWSTSTRSARKQSGSAAKRVYVQEPRAQDEALGGALSWPTRALLQQVQTSDHSKGDGRTAPRGRWTKCSLQALTGSRPSSPKMVCEKTETTRRRQGASGQ